MFQKKSESDIFHLTSHSKTQANLIFFLENLWFSSLFDHSEPCSSHRWTLEASKGLLKASGGEENRGFARVTL